MIHLPRKQITPNDSHVYEISGELIARTENVLSDYRGLNPSNEGIVYWAGKRNGDFITITHVIAPAAQSNSGRVVVSQDANFQVVKFLSANNIVQIAQVHSHPTDWVDHSEGDDLYAAFKTDGLVSIVVQNYGAQGMLPLDSCGVHRYEKNRFIRLSSLYIGSHFKINKNLKVHFEDQR